MRALRSAMFICVVAQAVTLTSCGSEQDLEARGVETQPEVAVPEDAHALAETEAERRKENIAEEEE